ncbi:hypothetical protein GGR01_003065 [Acetobacter oeni]|nr:hypothetical protein [Acetobacter oeni]
MFKILVIQTLNNLSDARTEYLINDRLSFMRFLSLGLSDRVPDAKTIRLFRERLTQAGAIERLFDRFNATLRDASYLPMSGQILDATLVAAPKQRNTNGEKADLRAGDIPEAWRDKPAKLSHKDRQARWTLKFTKARRQEDGIIPATDLAIPFFGYKSHVFIERKFRLIRRSRVEYVFADQKSQMGLFIRTVGIRRATMRIGLANIVYNMPRFLCLERITTAASRPKGKQPSLCCKSSTKDIKQNFNSRHQVINRRLFDPCTFSYVERFPSAGDLSEQNHPAFSPESRAPGDCPVGGNFCWVDSLHPNHHQDPR